MEFREKNWAAPAVLILARQCGVLGSNDLARPPAAGRPPRDDVGVAHRRAVRSLTRTARVSARPQPRGRSWRCSIISSWSGRSIGRTCRTRSRHHPAARRPTATSTCLVRHRSRRAGESHSNRSAVRQDAIARRDARRLPPRPCPPPRLRADDHRRSAGALRRAPGLRRLSVGAASSRRTSNVTFCRFARLRRMRRFPNGSSWVPRVPTFLSSRSPSPHHHITTSPHHHITTSPHRPVSVYTPPPESRRAPRTGRRAPSAPSCVPDLHDARALQHDDEVGHAALSRSDARR